MSNQSTTPTLEGINYCPDPDSTITDRDRRSVFSKIRQAASTYASDFATGKVGLLVVPVSVLTSALLTASDASTSIDALKILAINGAAAHTVENVVSGLNLLSAEDCPGDAVDQAASAFLSTGSWMLATSISLALGPQYGVLVLPAAEIVRSAVLNRLLSSGIPVPRQEHED